MVTVQHIVYLVARTVHHHVNDAQVGYEIVTALPVADVIVATQELKVDAHLFESILGIEFRSGDRVDIVRTTAMQASATDNFRCLAIPAG